MRCTHCGTVLSDDELICPKCGAEVQIVPDYNPLDDVLAQQVRGSVEDATRPIGTQDLRRYRREETKENGNATRVLNQGELERIRGSRRAAYQTYSQRNSQNRSTGNVRTNTGDIRRSPQARHRQQQARKKKAAKKRLQKIMILVLILLLIFAAVGFILYQNSYAGIVRKGNNALASGEYSRAEDYFNRAIQKNEGKEDAYVGLSKVYIQQDDLDTAENVFLNALERQPSNAELYEAAIHFYLDTEQPEKISELLEGCEDENVLKKVKAYVSSAPEFTLPEGTYEEVQEVSLEAGEGSVIYYTTDGSEPSASSTQYTEPILLEEGETEIQALAVNKKGIPSVVVSQTYIIDIPIADAPSVSPSTGKYEEPTQITINVPEGYTAYYTMDGTEPTTASNEYTGAIDMPEGQTIFSAILVNNNNGKITPTTKKTYILSLE